MGLYNWPPILIFILSFFHIKNNFCTNFIGKPYRYYIVPDKAAQKVIPENLSEDFVITATAHFLDGTTETKTITIIFDPNDI